MSKGLIDIFFYVFSILTVIISLVEVIISLFIKRNKLENNHYIEKSIKVSLFIVSSLVVLFGFWTSNIKDNEFNEFKLNQDSLRNTHILEIENLKKSQIEKNIELEKEKQKTQSIIDENNSFKEYRINLMNQSSFRTFLIFVDSTNHFDSKNYFLKENFYSSAFLFTYTYNNNALLGHNKEFTIKPTKEDYFDIFEISFFEWYQQLYFGSWYVYDEQYSLMSGGSSYPKKIEKTIINGNYLIKKLLKNKALIYRKNVFEQCRIILPPKTTLDITQNRNYSILDSSDNCFDTEILIKNSLFTLTIKLDENDFFLLDNKYIISKIGLYNLIKPDNKIKALELRVYANLKVNENIDFNVESAKQFYWANQLLKNIEKSFKY